VAHAHIALLGFAGFIAAGGIYFILPEVTGNRLYSKRLADAQYWLMLLGTLGIFLTLTFAGLIQGEAWLNGEVVYRVLPELKIYLVARGVSGVLLVIASMIFVFNVTMTIFGKQASESIEESTASEVLA